MKPAIHVFTDAHGACAAAADRIVRLAAAAIADRGRFSLVLSGGSTPRPLYRMLADPPWKQRIEWPRVDFFWSDERAVPSDHPDSNFRMAREALLEPLRIDAARIHPMHADRSDLQAAAAQYEQEIFRCLGSGTDGAPRPFDCVLLGLGEDGHTASLFPHSPALEELKRLTVATKAPQPNAERLTLTYPPLNSARAVLFLVSGEQKAAVLAAVLQGPRDTGRLPAQGIEPGVSVQWFVDTAAAAALNPWP